MHTYGYPSPDTPNLDELAREGVVFSTGIRPGSWTTPSFGSILTGMYPDGPWHDLAATEWLRRGDYPRLALRQQFRPCLIS